MSRAALSLLDSDVVKRGAAHGDNQLLKIACREGMYEVVDKLLAIPIVESTFKSSPLPIHSLIFPGMEKNVLRLLQVEKVAEGAADENNLALKKACELNFEDVALELFALSSVQESLWVQSSLLDEEPTIEILFHHAFDHHMNKLCTQILMPENDEFDYYFPFALDLTHTLKKCAKERWPDLAHAIIWRRRNHFPAADRHKLMNDP